MSTTSEFRNRIVVYSALAIATAWTLTYGWAFTFYLAIAIFG